MAEHLHWLDQIQPHHRALVGEIAYALGMALQQGYPVLPGLVVSSPLFRQFLESVNWVEPLFSDLPNSSLHVDVENAHQLQAIAQRIQQLIQAQTLSNEHQDAIYTTAQCLQSAVVRVQPSLSLRLPQPQQTRYASDRVAASLSAAHALLPKRICPIKKAELTQTVRHVWASFFQANHLFYWKRLGIPFHYLQLSALIQPVPSTLASGTVQIQPNVVEIQAIWGAVSALIEGDVNPDRYRFHEQIQTEHHIGTKRYAYRSPHPCSHACDAEDGQQTVTDDVTDDMTDDVTDDMTDDGLRHALSRQKATQAVLSDRMLQYVLEITQGLNHVIDRELQLEWAIYPTQGTHFTLPPKTSGVDPIDPLTDPLTDPLNTLIKPIDNGRWSQDDPTFRLIVEPGLLNVDALVLDQKQYSFYLTQILPLSKAVERKEPTVITTLNTVLPAVDIALGHQQAHQSGDLVYGNDVYGNDSPNPDRLPLMPSSLAGIGTSTGRVTAPAWVVTEPNHVPDHVPSGYILVAHTITPAWLKLMRTAKGLVSTAGGMTSHGAILARELGIPSVMGVKNAIASLQTGDWICIDGDRGLVTPTEADSSVAHEPGAHEPGAHEPGAHEPGAHEPEEFRTATQLMVSLSQADRLETLAKAGIDGVGLIRAELMLASLLSHQPVAQWLAPNHRPLLVQTIYHHVKQIAQAFSPRSVWYRTLDMRTHEFQPQFGTENEPNPLLGWHGTFSYQTSPDFFLAELAALNQLQKEGWTNISIILPFVRTVEEFRFCHQLIQKAGLLQYPCQVWIMAEVPSVLMLLPDYIAAGIQGIAIGSNDLAQLMLASDRTNPAMGNLLQVPHPSVLRAIQSIISAAQQANIPCSVCGELVSQHPEVIESLIRWGVTTLSVGPDAIEHTQREIVRAEKRLFLEWGRDRH